MNANALQLVVAGIVGLVSAVTSYRALRDFSTFGGSSFPLSLCFGALASVGVMQLGGKLAVLTLPWAALGITLCLLPLIRLLVGRRGATFKMQRTHAPDLPVSPAGPSKSLPQRQYPIGGLLPPEKGE